MKQTLLVLFITLLFGCSSSRKLPNGNAFYETNKFYFEYPSKWVKNKKGNRIFLQFYDNHSEKGLINNLNIASFDKDQITEPPIKVAIVHHIELRKRQFSKIEVKSNNVDFKNSTYLELKLFKGDSISRYEIIKFYETENQIFSLDFYSDIKNFQNEYNNAQIVFNSFKLKKD